MRYFNVLAFLVLTGCVATPAEPTPETEPDDPNTIWAVDLVRTLPGQQAAYIESIENNWAGARKLVREQGHILSYRALAAPPDSARGWDVMLMTEYRDSTAWANREAIFQEVFDSPEFIRVPTQRPSDEMRTFAAGEITLRSFVSVP